MVSLCNPLDEILFFYLKTGMPLPTLTAGDITANKTVSQVIKRYILLGEELDVWLKVIQMAWRDDSVSEYCSYILPEFSSQHPCGESHNHP